METLQNETVTNNRGTIAKISQDSEGFNIFRVTRIINYTQILESKDYSTLRGARKGARKHIEA